MTKPSIRELYKMDYNLANRMVTHFEFKSKCLEIFGGDAANPEFLEKEKKRVEAHISNFNNYINYIRKEDELKCVRRMLSKAKEREEKEETDEYLVERLPDVESKLIQELEDLEKKLRRGYIMIWQEIESGSLDFNNEE